MRLACPMWRCLELGTQWQFFKVPTLGGHGFPREAKLKLCWCHLVLFCALSNDMLWHYFVPNFDESAKNPKMGGLRRAVPLKRSWNVKISFRSTMRNGLQHLWVQKKLQDFAETFAQMGYYQNFDTTPIAPPLTQCCNL